MREVVIIGGGYAGVRAMQRLSKEDFKITLIDQKPYHYLQTEAYALIAQRATLVDVSVDLVTLCRSYKNVDFINSCVENIDFEKMVVYCKDSSYSYDYLVLAMGSRTNFPPVVKGLKEYSNGVKSLYHAFAFRQKFENELFMRMRSETDSECRSFNVVIAGAGLSGVEIAAEMACYTEEFMRSNRMVCDSIQIYLISAGKSVLEGLDRYLIKKSEQRLKELGVVLRLNTLVNEVKDGLAVLSSGEEIIFDFMIFAGGITASSLTRSIDVERNRIGQIIVKPDLSVAEHQGVFAIGDSAELRDKELNIVAPTANSAEKSAEVVAKNISLDAEGREMLEADLKLEGVMVALGRNSASVVLFDKIKFSGLLGYWLKKLITFRYKYLLDRDALRAYREIKMSKRERI